MFFVRPLSWLVYLAFISSVIAQRRGGSSSSSSSDSDSDNDDDSSSSGGSDSLGFRHENVYGPKWPYRWPGSYYNGTITINGTIESWPNCSETSRDFNARMDGILMVGPGKSRELTYENEPRFLLVGWDQGIEPVNNWTDFQYYVNGGPGGTLYYSPDVKLMLSRFVNIWHSKAELEHEWALGWTAESAGVDGEQYKVEGNWTGALTFNARDISQDNWVNLQIPSCSSSATDRFQAQLMRNTAAIRDWAAVGNTSYSGTFTDQVASFTWDTNYWAGFSQVDFDGVASDKDDYPQGPMTIKFEGRIDEEQSDPLTPRPTARPGFPRTLNGPVWTESMDRVKNTPLLKRWFDSSAETVTATRWVMAVVGCVAYLVM